MNTKQTLQNIWSVTDRPLIDIMTKTKHATPVRDNSDNSSDSDSEESRRGSFLAVPKEFRPKLTSHETKKKNVIDKVLHSQKPTIQSKNSAFTENPSHKLNYSTTQSKELCNPVKYEQAMSPNLTTEIKREENCSQITKNMPSGQNANRPKTNTYKYTCKSRPPVKFEHIISSNLPNEMKRYENCSQIIKKIPPGQNTNRPYQPMIPSHLTAEMKQHENYPQITTNISSGQNTAEKDEQEISPNLTTEMKRQKNCFQMKINMSSGQNAGRGNKAENCKTVRYVAPEKLQVINDLSSFKEQIYVQTSKASKSKKQGNRLQYEHVGKEHEIIQYNFDMVQEKKSISKEGLIYEAKILKKDSSNPHSETKQNNSKEQYQTAVHESTVKWASSLNLNKQNDDYLNEVKQTVTYDTNASIPKCKRNTNQKNLKPPNKNPTNQMRKPRRGKFNRKFNNSLEENNFKQDKQVSDPKQMKSKINREENESGSETFYKNNFQLANNLNIKTKINNSNANTEVMNMNEDFRWICKTSEHGSTGNHGTYPNLSTLLQNKLQQELNENQEFNSRARNPARKIIKDTEDLKSILQYGKDLSDFIIGSHTALSTFIALYQEWKTSRHELIKHFELLEKNLKESSKSCSRYRDVIDMANKGATIAAAIPHPYVSLAAKIISLLTGLFATFTTKSKEGNTDETNEITTSLLKDAHASSELCMYGLQCNQQFEETAKLIEEFHLTSEKKKLFVTESRELAKFIQGILEYKPTHRIFYRKMHKCFQELVDCGSSSEARRFCEPFTLHPSAALDVIGYLDWRFPYDDFNSESVRHELENLHKLIQCSDSTSLKDLVQKIKNCIRILNDELTFIERSLKNISLFNTNPKQVT